MRSMLTGLLVLASGLSFGQSTFTGTWVTDLKSVQYSGTPFSFSLKDGTYRCDTCVPKVEIPADGKDHPTKGFPYADSISVRTTDDNTIEIVRKKAGKVERSSKTVVSADGNTLTVEWTFFPKRTGRTRETRLLANRCRSGRGAQGFRFMAAKAIRRRIGQRLDGHL